MPYEEALWFINAEDSLRGGVDELRPVQALGAGFKKQISL
jgi:hypothetical protein